MKSIILSVLIILSLSCTKSKVNNGVESKMDTVIPQISSSKKDGYIIGFANGYFGNTWRSQLVANFERTASEYKNKGIIKEYIVANSNSDVIEQINQINAMLNKGVDAILIDPVSPTSIKPVVDKAKELGILVVIANDPAAYNGTIAVCGNNENWQKIQAKWIAEKLKGSGDIVEITGEPGNSADILRQNANKEILKDYPNIKVLTSAPGKWSPTTAQQVMTTILSSYNNIDAVLTQDVMAEGIMKAYENANRQLPLMTGDYTKSFLNRWKSISTLDSIAVPYAPGISVNALDITIMLLQGEKLKESVLKPNPMDETLVNTILIDPPYVVTKEGDQDAVWMKGLIGTKAITLDEALLLLKDAPNTAALDGWLSIEEVRTFFE